MKCTRFITVLIFFSALVVGSVFLYARNKNDTPVPAYEHPLVRIDSPAPGARVIDPLRVTGEARGNWYFEATFPLVVVDWDGRIIGEGFATALGDWMTTDFVPFTGEVSFILPYDPNDTNVPDFMKRGVLIVQKSNPSGLPEQDDAVDIPIVF